MSFAPWIKLETTTPDKPEVIAMATRLKVRDPDTVTGKLVRLWCWADANSADGTGMTITRAFIDRYVSCRGFAAALEAVGWLSGPDGDITFANFDRHNGDSAKKRAVETRKKQRQRGGQKGGQSEPASGDGSPPPHGTEAGTNVPHPTGQKGGPEEEIEIELKSVCERGRTDAGESFEELALRIASHYPRREKFNSAIQLVASQLKNGEDAAAMLAGTQAIAAVIKELPSGAQNRYVPSAESFFRDKRWQDDPAAFRRDAAPSAGGRQQKPGHSNSYGETSSLD